MKRRGRPPKAQAKNKTVKPVAPAKRRGRPAKAEANKKPTTKNPIAQNGITEAKVKRVQTKIARIEKLVSEINTLLA